ncbi:GTP-binding protein 1 [Niveomyces insectorum RCEF 264]|uniref:GTP-binding protein 1 n=1 Tax=Niveomyces insectorum RCEF 264 TaxID=1081102 RepID=A0A167WAL7_9HYPO|nr:GTP-binding protein 1 [Niveomyces insectorum RCEF 264]
MSGTGGTTMPPERRKGETSLSDFADYVDKQQAARQQGHPPNTASTATASTATASATSAHDSTLDDLDDLLDSLVLSDAAPRIPLRRLLVPVATAADAIADPKADSPTVKPTAAGNDTEPDADLDALATLFTARLDAGHGETVFDLGFEPDDANASLHLTPAEWAVAWPRVQRAADRAGADCELLLTRNVAGSPVEAGQTADKPQQRQQQQHHNRHTTATTTNNNNKQGNNGSGSHRGGKDCTGIVLIRRRPRSVEEVIETRIAVVGNVDAGKSSLLGVLVKGDLDDGRGKARVNLFRHKHEFETGRTSSVGMEILGFDTKGQVVKSDTGRKLSWEEIGKRSAKVITFTDLAGHERYLRTTMFGMMSTAPHYCLLMVAANNGLIGMSKEHLGIALALNVPVLVVVTKIDICPPNILQETLTQLTRVLRSPGARKVPILVKTRDDCVSTATQFVSQRICPIFQVSNVTGEHLDLVRTFLNMLPCRHVGGGGGTATTTNGTSADNTPDNNNNNDNAALEFHVNDIYSVPHVGTVVSGIVKAGVAHAGDAIWIGPDANGHFLPTTIWSIERKRIGVPAASAGQSASFALRRIRRKDVRKGQVVLARSKDKDKDKDQQQQQQPLLRVHWAFVAEVLILSHATTIKPKYQATLHVGAVAQTCAIVDMDRPLLRTGERALVAFRFLQRPEYLVPGDRLLFREGKTKGYGLVKSVGYDPEHPLRSPVADSAGGAGDAGSAAGAVNAADTADKAAAEKAA